MWSSPVQVNTYLLVRVHCLNVFSLDAHQCGGRGLPPEVHDRFFCLAGVDLESVGLGPVDKVTDGPSVFLVVPI